MLPYYPFNANQGNNGAPTAPLPQQANVNSRSGMQNFMPLQGQSQVGFNPSPQNPAPFNNNSNPIMGHGNQVSMPQQTHGGFGLQNLNAFADFPNNGNLGNFVAQNLLSGLLANDSMNALNPNACLVNAQLALQNQLQSVNQLLSMALSNSKQLNFFNPMAASGNQLAQGVILQNGAFLGNPQLGLPLNNGVGQQVSLGQQNTFRPMMNGNVSNLFSAPNQPNSQPMSVQHQGIQYNRDRMNISYPNHRQNRTFNRDHKGGTSNWRDRFQNAHNQYPPIMNGKQNFSNESRENDGGKRRSLVTLYSEKEIQLWRDERKKFYPTKANVQKKQQLPDGGDAEQEVEVRRQQLKTILAKQAELGFEVAEIPPHYLSDAENKQLGNNQRKRPFKQNDRFQNRFNNKRGRFDHNEKRGGHFPKQQRQNENGSWKNQASTREPTLRQKLMTSDVKRDRFHLFQAFRFMVMNSFF